MKIKNSDNLIVSTLIVALIIQIALLLWHMGFINFQSSEDFSSAQLPAGKIIQTQNQLRKRPLNSLVWESSQVHETIFFYDSLLTLSQSAAKLQLNNGTEIQLSENTLVTIEPPEKEHQGEIRLKFSKGNIRARNQFQKTKFLGEQFVLDLKENSEVKINQIGDKNFEIQVLSGKADLQKKGSTTKLNNKNLVKIFNGNVQKFSINSQLKWLESPEKRIYTHKTKEPINLKWKGLPDTLIIQSQGKEERKIHLSSEQQVFQQNFQQGTHRLTLERKSQRSTSLEFEIWKAPIIHLIQPLPRDRVKTEKVQFLWIPVTSVKSYSFRLNGKNYNVNEDTDLNSFSYQFQKEDNSKWSVWGRDKDGFFIPPLYDYPLYIREKPFSAPILNQPILIKPKNYKTPKSSSLLNLLIVKAFAADLIYEALFSWQKVDGADQYRVEISETPDFRNPIVQTTTKQSQFLWNNVNKKKQYYWRVAAGSQSGRMGLFSAAIPITLQITKLKKPIEEKKTINIQKAKEPKVITTAVIKERSDKKLKKKYVTKELVSNTKTRILWKSGYYSIQATAPQNVTAKLQGLVYSSLQLERDWNLPNTNIWSFGLNYTMSEFKPTSKRKYPFQKNLNLSFADIYGTYSSWESHWGYGLRIKMIPTITRESFEIVQQQNLLLYGPNLKYFINEDVHSFASHLTLLASNTMYGATNHTQYRYNLLSYLVLGLEIEATYLQGTSHNYFQWNSNVLLGLEF